MNRALVLAVLAATCAGLSCKVNDYCLACQTGDGGGGTGDGNDGGDGGAGDGGNCIPTGEEICDGKDNDCDGIIDEGTLAGVGALCANQMGVCAGGTMQCLPATPGDPTTDTLTCNKQPSAEICDGLDNNCNGQVDEDDPGGGGRCGNGTGTCVQGVQHCVGGSIQCVGGTGPVQEICDGLDNDCDGIIDDNLGSLGMCGTSSIGACKLGANQCIGGTTVCVGAVNPTFELCNGIDDDCDGAIDEDFNLDADPQNCGACNHICGAGLTNGGNAVWGCSAGSCVIASCDSGYHDNNNDPSDGCEFGPCFITGAEVCDGQDNDCDGNIDEDLGTPPAICLTQGECAGTVATCTGAGGWVCNYGSTVSTDGMGNIVPETLCDGKDNDCDGIIDNNQPQLAHADGTALFPPACHDSGLGVCQGTGHYVCGDEVTPPQDPNGPAQCLITQNGQSPQPEACNNLDDDCDGIVDEGASTGNLIGQDWVNVGGGHQMMKYEASKPDASGTDQGSVTTATCSQPGVMPWTNVKYSQALAACQAIGATLCSESAWHRACSVVTPTTYPLAVSGSGTLIEAEDYYAIATGVSGGTTRSWVEDETPGFSGISDLEAIPDTGAAPTQAQAPTQSPRLDYLIDFTASSANYHVWVHMLAPNANGNDVYVGISALAPPQTPTNTATNGTTATWQWRDAGAFNVPAVGNRYVSLYMAKDGVKVDAIYILIGTATPNPTLAGPGGTWAYATSPNTYQPTTCNGHDYNASLSQPDATLPTGSLASCYAADSASDHAFDMSGNVSEWVLAHQAGENPIRGGASSDIANGLSCPDDFVLADDSFFFPTVGFRCCR
ncbi:MAG TPA: MopE-related protein [Kofleriaceae bacterium]|nr:MopE-related protein [Kofleriaceae bacterium]